MTPMDTPKPPELTQDSAKTALMKGAAWALAMRWSVRGMGLISTAVLARLLKPEDYGLIAMAYLVVGLLEAFLNVGAAQALIRLGQTGSQEHINSAWTLRALQGLLIGLIISISAPYAGVYFNEPRLPTVLWTLAACLACMGFANIGMALAYRDLQFKTEFKQIFLTKLAGMAATLGTAPWLLDYRALLAGLVTAYVAEFLLSYSLHPYRPRLAISKVAELWNVSKWLLVTGLGGYLLGRFDYLVASKVGNTHQFGLYSVGNDIGGLVSGEVGGTLARPLFPTLANLKHNWQAAEDTALKLMETIAYVVLPLGVGLAVVSPQATLVLLGQQWTEAAPYMAGFALIGALSSMFGPLGTVLAVSGHMKSESLAVWLDFLVFALSTLLLIQDFGLISLIYGRLSGTVVKVGVLMIAVSKLSQFRLRRLLHTFQNPMLAALCMAATIWAHPWPAIDYLLVEFLILILSGAVVYTTVSMALWWARGKPDGFVGFCLNKVKIKKNTQ